MKSIFSLVIFLFFSIATAQNHQTPTNSNEDIAYVSYSSYKMIKNSSKMKVDSLGFSIFKTDTLIKVIGMKKFRGIQVQYEPKDSLFLEKYKNLVFNKSSTSDKKKNKPTMKIWKDEIKVYFDSTVTKKSRIELTKLMKYLDKEIDSLKIKVVNSKEKSNYFVYFINKPSDINWDTRINGTDGCYISWNGKQQLYNCTMKIDAQIIYNEKQQLQLMKKNFIWSLGYFYYQNDQKCTSFFSSCVSLDKELNAEDLELLKYHYSYGICKGTDLETFENNHETAKKSIKNNPKGKFTFSH